MRHFMTTVEPFSDDIHVFELDSPCKAESMRIVDESCTTQSHTLFIDKQYFSNMNASRQTLVFREPVQIKKCFSFKFRNKNPWSAQVRIEVMESDSH